MEPHPHQLMTENQDDRPQIRICLRGAGCLRLSICLCNGGRLGALQMQREPQFP